LRQRTEISYRLNAQDRHFYLKELSNVIDIRIDVDGDCVEKYTRDCFSAGLSASVPASILLEHRLHQRIIMCIYKFSGGHSNLS